MASQDVIDTHIERLKGRIGLTGKPVTRRIEAGALIKFAHATGQTDPLFVDEDAARRGPFGALIAAPTYLSTFCAEALSGLLDLDLPFSLFLHTDDVVELGAPIRAGDDIRAIARYADVYLRQGRNGPMLFQIAEITLTNQHGEPAAKVEVGAVSFDAAGRKTDAQD